MERERIEREQQKRKQAARKRKRRIRRIKCYLCRTIVLILFCALAAGAIKLSGIVTRGFGEAPGNPPSAAGETGLSQFPPDSVSVSAYDNPDRLLDLGYDEAVIEALIRMAPGEEMIEEILTHANQYPPELLELLSKNAETVDFVHNYPFLSEKARIQEDLDLSDVYSPGSIPFFLQWDARWGYCQYGNHLIALSGCGPTCLSMVYVGLTGDTSKNPGVMAQFSEEEGFLDQNNNTVWALMTDGARSLGLSSRELSLDPGVLSRELEEGHPVICSMRPGDFTTEGHFIVIYGYEKGKFLVHDPNSRIRSEKRWDYDTLSRQIKNLWSFSN